MKYRLVNVMKLVIEFADCFQHCYSLLVCAVVLLVQAVPQMINLYNVVHYTINLYHQVNHHDMLSDTKRCTESTSVTL
jgi:hypothetical protein